MSPFVKFYFQLRVLVLCVVLTPCSVQCKGGGSNLAQSCNSLHHLPRKAYPLVIFNICACYVRCPDQADRVIGTLLGSVLPDGTVDIRVNESIEQVVVHPLKRKGREEVSEARRRREEREKRKEKEKKEGNPNF